jgi:hypothetical protein
MVARFVIFFVGLVAIQFLGILFVNGFLRIYDPFIDFVEPFVKRRYGGSDGSLGPLIMWGLVLGVAVYSTFLGVVGAFLMNRGASKLSSDA